MSSWKLLSWNVNGIRAVAKKGFMEWFKSESPDILCLQETKAQEDQLDNSIKEIEGYQSYWSAAVKKGYSGVGVYTRHEPISVHKGFGKDRFDSEGRTLILEYPDFTLFNVYFPNGKQNKDRLQYKMDFYEAILEHWEILRENGKRLIICGDVNTAHQEIDLSRPKENKKISGFLPMERAWIDKITTLGYIDTFRHFNTNPENYTWWHLMSGARARNVGWRIDYFFATADLIANISNGWISSDVMGSDHCPIGIEVKVQ